jgi:hypothetical protein
MPKVIRNIQLPPNVANPFAEGSRSLVVLLDILRDHFTFRKTPRHLLVDLGEFTALLLEKLLDIEDAVSIRLLAADQGIGVERWKVVLDAVCKRRVKMVERDEFAFRKTLACNLAS